MSRSDQEALVNLVSEEIRRIIADAIQSGECLDTGRHATRVATAYPGSGLSPEGIADELVRAAIQAGVPVEMSRPN